MHWDNDSISPLSDATNNTTFRVNTYGSTPLTKNASVVQGGIGTSGKDRIYLLGGQHDGTDVSATYWYNSDHGDWIPGQSMSKARSNFACGLIDISQSGSTVTNGPTFMVVAGGSDVDVSNSIESQS